MTKKNILFALFTIPFAILTVITILGVLEVIKIRDGYLDKLFYVLILELIACFKFESWRHHFS